MRILAIFDFIMTFYRRYFSIVPTGNLRFVQFRGDFGHLEGAILETCHSTNTAVTAGTSFSNDRRSKTTQ